MNATSSTGTRERQIGARRERQLILVAMCVALATVVSAVSSLNVALPEIARDLHATQTQLQWIVDAYAVVFAGLLLLAGALGDRLGRKPVLLFGLGVFSAAAAGALLVSDPGALTAVRAVMGLGAAAIMPATLSIITNVFPAEERDRAVSIWAGVAGGSALLGLLVSGALLELFAWESVFAFSAILGLGALIAAARIAPNSTTDRAELDVVAGALSALALSTLVYAIIEGPERGWTDPVTLTAFGVSLAFIVAFVAWELRRDQPLLDPRLFRLRGFTAGTASLAVQFFALFGFIFVILQYAQFVLGYSPLVAGIALAPVALVMMGLSPRVPRLLARFGRVWVAVSGLLVLAGGLAVLSTAGVDSGYLLLLAALIPMGIGHALATTPATTAIVSSLPRSKQGVASAVNDLAREVGGALGIAVLGSALADRYQAGTAEAVANLPPELAHRAQDALPAALELAERLGNRGADVAERAQAAFVNGLGLAMLIAACAAVLAAALVLWLSRTEVASRRPAGIAAGHGRAARHRTATGGTMDPHPHRVVVIGGGFGGLLAAKHLARARVELTLIDRRNFHLFQPLTYQVATGALSPAEICCPLRTIFKRRPNVRVLMGEVTDIDLGSRRLRATPTAGDAGPMTIGYDTLIAAGGSRYSYFGHDDWRQRAPEVKSLESALAVRGRLLSAFEAAEVGGAEKRRRGLLTFVVVGAGPTGVEMAGQIAELARDTLRRDFRSIDPRASRVLLVEMDDRVLRAFPPSLSRRAARSLERVGVTPMLGHTVVRIDAEAVTLEAADGSRERIPARTVIWAAGVTASRLAADLAQQAGGEVDRAGRVAVERDLTLPGHPEVFAIGDMVRVRDADGAAQVLPGLAPVAMQQGKHAARVVRARLRGSEGTAFRYRDKGNLATIGRARAVADLHRIRLSGFPAWVTWLLVHLWYLVGFQNRLLVLVRWSLSFLTPARGARLIARVAPPEETRPRPSVDGSQRRPPSLSLSRQR